MSEQIKSKLQRAVTLHQAGRLAEAQAIYQDVLKTDPNEFNSLHLSGVIALQTGAREEGLALIDRAIAVNPGSAAAHNNRGNALKELRRFREALVSYERTLVLNPALADAHNNRGNVLLSLELPEKALASYDRALSLTPADAEIHNNRGNALMQLGRPAEALASYGQALVFKPSYAEALANRGNALLDLNRPTEALASYDQALALNPNHADAHNSRGNALKHLGRLPEALASYERALSLAPGNAEAHNNRANLLVVLKRLDEALASYGQALALKPDYPFLFGTYVHTKAKLCDWSGLTGDLDRLSAAISTSQRVAQPFAVLTLLDDPAAQKTAAQVYAAARYPARRTPDLFHARPAGQKIRVAYYSADFQNHALPYLMIELFEQHDKEKFEFFGISVGPDKQDEMRGRLTGAFNTFIEASRKNDREIAALSRELGIDIAVDLSGYTDGARTAIFAAGCAPVQVSYVCYIGTMGAPYIDYLLADKVAIPPESRPHFTENVVYLPDTFFVGDSRRKISDRVFTRAELKLPETGFVFCCFNAVHKILPATFDGWMRILKAVEGSVLWLVDENDTAKNNLKKEARARGVDDRRLVFAGRVPVAEYLARFRVADLFLDTLPYNAHTTASDALWLGLPVLTLQGRAFAGRLASSLLMAARMPELVTTTQADYEARAIELATHPEKFRSVKARLLENRLATPVFDSRLTARRVEAAYAQMFARHQAGLPPAAFEIQS